MEFQLSHHTALMLAGTVPLPSPYPACGPVSLAITRDGEDYEVFVKILQVVSDRRIITRFVRPEDVRAIRGHSNGRDGGGPESWPLHGLKRIKGELDKRAKELLERARKTGVLDEAPWYAAAIVYVGESAPVLHRDEIGVTAAVSCEEVVFAETCCWTGCCHVAAIPLPEANGSPGGHVAEEPTAADRRHGRDRS
jgi:hypothetical protein